MQPVEFSNLPVYKKAIEIFRVSRAIACSISDNRNILEMENSKELNHRFAGELVIDALAIVPELAVVQNTSSHSLRLKRARKIQKAARGILQKCRKLEFKGVKEKEFLSLLKSEIQQFNRIFADWIYTLPMDNKVN